jgi:predicted nuclease with TOPRIM domain
MAEPESHTLAYLRRLDEKFDRLQKDVGELRTEVGERFDRVEGRLGAIEDELLVLNGIALRLEGREVETTGLKALFDRHERRLAELSGRLAELEDAPKR